MEDLVFTQNNQALTNSLLVAENFIKETLYGLFCGGETEILYFCGESVESAPIRRYVGRVMSGISRGEHPANFSAVNQPVLSY